MRNLRVHKEVSLELHPRLNFIIGANGSGKSSILTAIRLALGVKVDTRNLRALRRAAADGDGKVATAVRGGKANAAGTHDSVDINTLVRSGSDGETVAEVDIANEGKDEECLPHTIWGDKFIRLRRTLKVSDDDVTVVVSVGHWQPEWPAGGPRGPARSFGDSWSVGTGHLKVSTCKHLLHATCSGHWHCTRAGDSSWLTTPKPA